MHAFETASFIFVRSKHPQFISDTEKYLKVKSFDNLTEINPILISTFKKH